MTLPTDITSAPPNYTAAAHATHHNTAHGVLNALNGTSVANTPAGNIAATDVQAAINELDSEKVAKGTIVLNVKDYGALGDGSTNDTAAINAAIAAAAAGNQRTIYFPTGRYKVTSTLQINTKGIRFVGDRHGRIDVYGGSQIEASFNGVLIQLGTDDGLAYDRAGYDGAAEGFSAENIGFKATGTTTVLENATQSYCAGTTAIKDWRGGGIRLTNVFFLFFDFTVWSIQSDFNTFDNVDQWYCHSGIYIGPRSDQYTINRLQVKFCDRGIDIDRGTHVRINNSEIVDSGSATTNPVRIRSAWAAGSLGIIFDKVWFENLVGTVNIEAFVEIGIGDSVQSTDIVFRSPVLLTNNQVTTPHASFFIKTDNVDRIVVEDPSGGNIANLTQFARNVGTVSPSMYVRHGSVTNNLRAQNDSSGVLDFAMQRYASGIHLLQRDATTVPVLRLGKTGEAVSRISFLNTGRIQFSDGAASTDLDLERAAAGVLGVGAGHVIRTGKGATGSRPSASAVTAGSVWFDTTLNRPIWSDGTNWLGANGFPIDNDYLLSDLLVTGEESIPRDRVTSTGLTMTSGVLRLCYFTARKTETITQLTIDTGGTAAGATPTLVRMGVWTTDSTGALLAQVAATPNDTTLLAGTFTTYTKSLSASWAKVAGQRYAIGDLVVTAAAAPVILGGTTSLNNGHVNRAPRMAAQITAQADLPSTAAAGALSNTNNRPFHVMLP